MSSLYLNSLSALTPIRLKYSYNSQENLVDNYITFNTGLKTSTLQSTDNFQDISFNNETCLLLTSAVNLDKVFSAKVEENSFFGAVFLKPQDSAAYYVAYDKILNTVYLSPVPNQIYISPVSGTNEVELFIEKQRIQINKNYPFEAYLSYNSLDPESIHRQRFICNIQNKKMTLKTKTSSGYRYLAFCNDTVLRATGTVLNESTINDYVFDVEYVGINVHDIGFTPVNDYITYFFDFESSKNNKNLTINKTVESNPNNLLMTFAFDEVFNGTSNINIANLKNVATPAGGLATVNNTYTKEIVTTN